MADNTSEFNYTNIINITAEIETVVEEPERFHELIGARWMTIIAWILFAFTVTAVVYGVLSLCLIKKFRQFRNYVILSAITARMLILLFYLNEESIQNLVMHVLVVALIMYFTHSYSCWLLVLCYVFYVNFVKVFHLNFTRMYLKSSLFAWGAPAIANILLIMPTLFLLVYGSSGIITQQMVVVIFISLNLLPVAISLGLYIAVLYHLIRDSDASLNLSKWRRFYIATLIFLLSNVVVLTGLLDFFGVRNLVLDAIGDVLGEYINTIALVVYFITLESNRKIWRDFLAGRSSQNSVEMKSVSV